MKHLVRGTALPTMILVILGSHALWAQPCEDLRPTPGPLGYRVRGSQDRGDYRCEGTYFAPAAGDPVEVISFYRTRGKMPQGSAGLVLEILPPDLGPEFRGSSVSVVALSRSLGLSYRMQAKIPPKGRLRWPVGEVLHPAGLYPDGFGLLAWVETAERQRLLIPLTLQVEGSSPADAVSESLSLLVRPGLYLSQLAWRARPRQVASPPEWTKTGPAQAGQTVALVLPRMASGGEHQRLFVEIISQATDGRWCSSVPVQVALP